MPFCSCPQRSALRRTMRHVPIHTSHAPANLSSAPATHTHNWPPTPLVPNGDMCIPYPALHPKAPWNRVFAKHRATSPLFPKAMAQGLPHVQWRQLGGGWGGMRSRGREYGARVRGGCSGVVVGHCRFVRGDWGSWPDRADGVVAVAAINDTVPPPPPLVQPKLNAATPWDTRVHGGTIPLADPSLLVVL